jgi:hypothetical protein
VLLFAGSSAAIGLFFGAGLWKPKKHADESVAAGREFVEA